MTRAELAEELYNLIVIKGRWNGKPHNDPNSLLPRDYPLLPEWMREMWEDKAEEFAAENRFSLEA